MWGGKSWVLRWVPPPKNTHKRKCKHKPESKKASVVTTEISQVNYRKNFPIPLVSWTIVENNKMACFNNPTPWESLWMGWVVG